MLVNPNTGDLSTISITDLLSEFNDVNARIDEIRAEIQAEIPFGQFGGPDKTLDDDQVITFGGRVVTGGGMQADTLNNRMIVPVAGLYAIGFTQLCDARDDVRHVQCYMRKNGERIDGTIARILLRNSYTSHSTIGGTHFIVSLGAGDSIDWYCHQGPIYYEDDNYNLSNHYIYLIQRS